MATWQEFRTCPGCGLDLATGEGDRGCSWAECPYMPSDLDVYCEQCRFNFYSGEGNPPCEDPWTCECAAEPLAHVENVKRWREAHLRAEAARTAPDGG